MAKMRVFQIHFYQLVLLCFMVSGSVFAFCYHQANREADLLHKNEVVMAWPLLGHTIVLDAGHGGFDPGAVTESGIEEKTINLQITLELATLLREAGMEVILTREEDVALADNKKDDMAKRVQIGQESDCDLFLSIQANKYTTANERGCQVFFHPKSAESKQLAECIQGEMSRLLKNTRRKSMALDSSYLLRKLEMPTAIVEVGFISHPEEAALLQDHFYQEEVAWSIYSGIIQYFVLTEEKSDV